jgi:hypothetical protein
VYALCATLYAIMNGHPPRWRDDGVPSLVALMDLFAEPIPDLAGVPRSLLDVLRVGMANDAAARPSAEQLRDMLAGLSLQPARPVPVSPPTWSVPPAVVQVPGADEPTVPNRRNLWRRLTGR